ncbi:hypothetical protein HC246_16510 [Pseudanabaena yagii GIHE-NHR1]|uniref:site-specific DNA-methyltransferase (adenine-specific) n=1 Tax=Pseudanabaena yagii GIHE-NHR1 TaxID=2722753 RepID=A0ABX1M0D2_9CYAN|nr:hypothetical protein [Pseudanabaena yagii GIHE-NHR1]
MELEEIKRSDRHNPFFEPVNLNMQLQQLQASRENILAIAAKHGAFNVRVFGSVARGEADTKPAAKEPWTKEVWIYDYRTNVQHTLKKNPLKLEDLQPFIDCYKSGDRYHHTETWSEATPEGRWRKFSYDEIMARDKTNLDIFWLKDKSLADLDNLPDPDILANEIIENIEAGLDSFREIMENLNVIAI